MSALQTLRVSLAALTANALRTALTTLGIVIGVGAVIALISIGNGAQVTVQRQIQSLGTNLIFITPGATNTGGVRGGIGSAQTLTIQDAQAIGDPTQVQGISAVVPEILTGAQLVGTGRNAFTRLVGTTAEYAQAYDASLAEGSFFTDQEVQSRSTVAVLGATVAQEVFGSADPVGQQMLIFVPAARTSLHVRVLGVLRSKGGTGIANVDDQVLMPISSLSQYLSRQRAANGEQLVNLVAVQAQRASLVPQVQQGITSLLDARHQVATPDFTVVSQQDVSAAYESVTRNLTIVLGFIAGISLLVGGIGIMNIMLVSVVERTREIGIRKAVGARTRDILSQFLTESLVVSLAGGIVGVAVGIFASRLIDGKSLNGQPLHTVVSGGSVLLAVGVSVAIGLFFGMYPATRAARLDPIQALRYE